VAVLANRGIATTSVYGALVRRGHEVRLFTFHDPIVDGTQSRDGGVELEVVFLPPSLKWSPIALGRRIRKELLASPPQILHAHIAIPYGMGAALTRWHPFLLSTHGTDVYYRAWRTKLAQALGPLPPGLGSVAFRATHAFLAACVDNVIVYSPDMLEWLPHLGYPRTKLSSCDLGIDILPFQRVPISPPDGEFRIVCTRNLEPIYDHPAIFRSLAALRRRGVNARLTLAGDGSARLSLEAMVQDLDLVDTVEFLGAVPHDILPEVLARSDVFVSASHSDAAPQSVLEAMAIGLPVVVTRVGSLPLRIVEGESGFLFDPGDVDRLTSRLELLAADEALRRKMGQANRERASREFDVRKTVDRLEEIYQRFAT
jgi:L-malate glycosyltransferase